MKVLEAKGLKKSFTYPHKFEILSNVDLDVSKGETVAIMGRSGEGKSTLLHILGTLDIPCSGEIKICGQSVNRMNSTQIRNKNLGFIFQSFHLLEDYTALENVLMPAHIARASVDKHSAAYSQAMHLLERMNVADRAHFNTKQLSGGEKQRIAIARALCNNPDILLADEPSGNLDRQTASEIHALLLSFARDHNKSLIVVTHDHELASLCDRRYQLKEGQLWLHGH